MGGTGVLVTCSYEVTVSYILDLGMEMWSLK